MELIATLIAVWVPKPFCFKPNRDAPQKNPCYHLLSTPKTLDFYGLMRYTYVYKS
jgi:hypothetical protein